MGTLVVFSELLLVRTQKLRLSKERRRKRHEFTHRLQRASNNSLEVGSNRPPPGKVFELAKRARHRGKTLPQERQE
ncbi:MAG TPA: hypothetical protein VLY24_22915 [Bryobacteraceae bacterium]|nr:hypothetical protein [Bryobacteraceae bacterium]